MAMTITLATTENASETALAPYADEKVLLELATRLLDFHPAAAEVGRPGMLLAAQLAILMGASPLPGTNEIHIWKDKKDRPVVVPGINYWRRRSKALGGVFWDFEKRPMTAAERDAYGIRPGFLAAICRGVPGADIEYWTAKGVSWDQAIKSFGITGIGVVKQGDYEKEGRPLIWTALKRCQTDFYKQAFPYVPGEKPIVEPGRGMILNHETGSYQPDYDYKWREIDRSLDETDYVGLAEDEHPEQLNYDLGLIDKLPPVESEVIDNQEEPPAEELPVLLLYGNDKTEVDLENEREQKAFASYVEIEGKKPFSRPVLRTWANQQPRSAEDVRAGLLKKAANGYQGPVTNNSNMLGVVSIAMSKVFPKQKNRYAALDWLFGVASNKDLTGGQAHALIGWIGGTATNDYAPNDKAMKEGANILAAALRDNEEE
jgi:hypothetical protein